jgi:hypothetical protein
MPEGVAVFVNFALCEIAKMFLPGGLHALDRLTMQDVALNPVVAPEVATKFMHSCMGVLGGLPRLHSDQTL